MKKLIENKEVMKKTSLLLTALLALLCLPRFSANAQCYDCMEREKGEDWRFAAGITLYSNNPYQSYLDLPRQPWEFNFRYKIGNHHVLRMSLPMAVNRDLGEGWRHYPRQYDGKKSLEDYYAQMKKEMDFQQYFHTLKNRYSLYGIALGYDYNHSIVPALSAFGGAEVAYYHAVHKFNYYEIDYSLRIADNLYPTQVDNSPVFVMSYVNTHAQWDVYTLKPLLGIRYQFQKLLFEASMSYSFQSNGSVGGRTTDYFQPNYDTSWQTNDNFTIMRYGYQEFEYQLSLYYTF